MWIDSILKSRDITLPTKVHLVKAMVFPVVIYVCEENYNTLATWCRELTHLKILWCWERLRARGEGDGRGWDGWMASPTQWTWVWVSSNHLILCCPLLLLPSIFPSIRVFSNESALCIRWSRFWSFSSTSVLPVNIQDWFPLGWTGWISLQSKGLSRVFSTPQFKSINSSALSFLWRGSLGAPWAASRESSLLIRLERGS